MFLSPFLLWLLIGIVFMIAEIFVFGFVIFFFGIGALVTALLLLLAPTMSYALQIGIFIVLSIATLVFFRKYLTRIFHGRTYREESSIKDFNFEPGKLVHVVEAIDPEKGTGKIRYQGTLWNASAEEYIDTGATVEIIDQDNLTMKVKKIQG